ncbi:8524_t:CDS:2 [Entrophospora sp. SA101]|nr:8524_t:CDS:2 [Entrophospora sp. SA101]
MTSSHLWAPSLEPRTIINSWAYKHAIINECVSIGKEEDEYEAQVLNGNVNEDRDGDEEMVQDNGLNNRNNSLNFYNNNAAGLFFGLEPQCLFVNSAKNSGVSSVICDLSSFRISDIIQ